MRKYYIVCEKCGAHLDPGETCDCTESNERINAETDDFPGGYSKLGLLDIYKEIAEKSPEEIEKEYKDLQSTDLYKNMGRRVASAIGEMYMRAFIESENRHKKTRPNNHERTHAHEVLMD